MAESEEVLDLRRRARRRLIGASALVLFLVVVPPWLMDLEPRPVSSNLSVEIPGKDAPKLDARAIPVPPVTKPPAGGDKSSAIVELPESKGPPTQAKAGPAGPREDVDSTVRKAEKTDKKATEKAVATAKPAPTTPEAPPARSDAAAKDAPDGDRAAAILKNEVFFFQLGAFANRDNAKSVQQKASGAGVKTSLEVVEVKGAEQTRVFAGPFASREAAEKARTRIKEAGLEPGPVRAR